MKHIANGIMLILLLTSINAFAGKVTIVQQPINPSSYAQSEKAITVHALKIKDGELDRYLMNKYSSAPHVALSGEVYSHFFLTNGLYDNKSELYEIAAKLDSFCHVTSHSDGQLSCQTS